MKYIFRSNEIRYSSIVEFSKVKPTKENNHRKIQQTRSRIYVKLY